MSRASSSWLSVTNLPPGSTADDFTLLFSQSGCVSSRLSSDRDGRAIGYLEFPDETSAMTARNFYAGFQVDGTGGPGLALEPTGGFPGEEDGGRASGSKRPRAEYEPRHDEYERNQPYDPENSGPAYNPPPHQQHQQHQPQAQYHQAPPPTTHLSAAHPPRGDAHAAPYGGGPQRTAEPPRWEPPMQPQMMPPQTMPPPPQHQAHARHPNPPPPQNQMGTQRMSAPLTQPLPTPVPLPRPRARTAARRRLWRAASPARARRAPRRVRKRAADKRAADGRATDAAAAWRAPDPAPLARPLGARPSPAPPDASATLYVEGVPADATRREMAHVFRPFEGFRSTRLVSKENVRGPLCFAEFDDARRASQAKDTLQGYLIDRDAPESGALRVSFAKTQDRKKTSRGRKTKP